MRRSAVMALTHMTSALSHKPSAAVGAAASLRNQPLQMHSLQHAPCVAAGGISTHSGPQLAARSVASGRLFSVAARASAVAAPPQEAEEAYDLIQEVDWNRELSNTITLIGHLGADPVRKVLPSGVPVVNFNVAYKVPPSQTGAERAAEWHKIELFGELADEAAAKLRKGQQIALHGRLRMVTWNDRETGQSRSAPKVIADQLAIVKPYSGPSAGPPPPAAEHMQSQAQTAEFEPRYESPSSAAPRNSQKVGSGPADVKWEKFFQDTNAWWDNRTTKMNPKQPDFKHKDDGQALWLNGAPAWAMQQLVERGLAGSDEEQVPF